MPPLTPEQDELRSQFGLLFFGQDGEWAQNHKPIIDKAMQLVAHHTAQAVDKAKKHGWSIGYMAGYAAALAPPEEGKGE